MSEYELNLHKTCKKCKALRREIGETQHKVRRLTGGTSTTGRHVPMSRLKERLAAAQAKLQAHLDAEFDKMPVWDQHKAVQLNPDLASPAYKQAFYQGLMDDIWSNSRDD